MNAPAPPGPAPSQGAGLAGVPPAPFIRPHRPGEAPAFAPLSPRVVLLIVAGLALGLLLWMARDAVRPFIVGLLFVYLLDPLVRRLAATGLRRSLAILVVYVGAFAAFFGFLWVTVGPLIDELLRFIADFPALAEQLSAQLQKLYDLYSHLELPAALREWIDQIIAGIGSGGGEGGVPLDLSWLIPIVSGAGSLIGAVFAYLILPVFVFYLLKDRVALTAAFDRSLPDAWRFDVWAIIRIGRACVRSVGARPAHPRLHGRDLHVSRPDGPQPVGRPGLRPVRGAPVDHRGRARARPDHRPDHLGRPGRPAGGDRRSGAGRGGAWAVPARAAGREQPARAQDPGRRGGVAPGHRHGGDHHRRLVGGAPRGDPGPARHGRRSRRRALPVPADEPGRPGTARGNHLQTRADPAGPLGRLRGVAPATEGSGG